MGIVCHIWMYLYFFHQYCTEPQQAEDYYAGLCMRQAINKRKRTERKEQKKLECIYIRVLNRNLVLYEKTQLEGPHAHKLILEGIMGGCQDDLRWQQIPRDNGPWEERHPILKPPS